MQVIIITDRQTLQYQLSDDTASVTVEPAGDCQVLCVTGMVKERKQFIRDIDGEGHAV
jgi:hypothetical protein